MMLDRRQSDYRETCSAKKSAFDIWWRDGLLGDDSYRVSLSVLRYTPGEIEMELHKLKAAKRVQYVR